MGDGKERCCCSGCIGGLGYNLLQKRVLLCRAAPAPILSRSSSLFRQNRRKTRDDSGPPEARAIHGHHTYEALCNTSYECATGMKQTREKHDAASERPETSNAHIQARNACGRIKLHACYASLATAGHGGAGGRTKTVSARTRHRFSARHPARTRGPHGWLFPTARLGMREVT